MVSKHIFPATNNDLGQSECVLFTYSIFIEVYFMPSTHKME